jgi:hypothetical protein
MTDLEQVARRLFWWKSPADALADPRRLLAQAQVMVYGTPDDVAVAREHFSKDDFKAVLTDPPAGLFDPRSWSYWHVVFGIEIPELPRRRIAEANR